MCYTVNFQRKLPLQERCIYCSITSTRGVNIWSVYIALFTSTREVLLQEKYFYKGGTFIRKVLLQERYFYKRSIFKAYSNNRSSACQSSRGQPCIRVFSACWTLQGSISSVGAILLNSLHIKRYWMESFILGLENLQKLNIVQDSCFT